MAGSRAAKLRIIEPAHLLSAMDEYRKIGRLPFLKRYGFSKSSKFYLYADGRFFDTKALVGGAYFYAANQHLSRSDFAGGPQTKAVIQRLWTDGHAGDDWLWFEDKFRELANLAGEFDRLPDGGASIKCIGFSDWIPFHQHADANTIMLPGVYVIAHSEGPPKKVSVIDKRIVYIGETTTQTLKKRLHQFSISIGGPRAHSGGCTLHAQGITASSLHIAIRPFPLDYRLEDSFARSVRSAQIKYLERMLLNLYAIAHGALPIGNSR